MTDGGSVTRDLSLKACFKACRDALSIRIRAIQEGVSAGSMLGLSLESVAAVALLIERGVVVDQDWHEIRDKFSRSAAETSANAPVERAALSQRILVRITPELATLSSVDQSIIPRYIDDAALLVYEFAAWAWVRHIETDDTLRIIRSGRKPGKNAPIEPDLNGLRMRYKNKGAQEVLKESEGIIEEHKRRVKWARRKLRVAALRPALVREQAADGDTTAAPNNSGAGKQRK